jgi:Zeta toxin
LENLESNGRKPVIVFVVGRQRVGKTVFLNVLAQYAREHGADFEIWDADISNASNNLSALHPGAKSPPSSNPEQAKAWLERQINHLMEDRVDVMVDVGGGETALTRVIAELPLADSLEEQGIRVVVVHMVGPDTADLDYLDRFEDGGLFAAPATLIVQNAGLVMTPGIDQAFASIYDHRTVGRVRERGGIVVQMPRLICMNEVTKRRLGFVEAYEGKKGADGTAVAFLDRVRVRNWWTKEVPGALFAEVPTTWFPGFPETAAATE